MSFKAFIEDQKKWWCKSYLADYATVVALIVIVSLFHWVFFSQYHFKKTNPAPFNHRF